MSATPKKVLVVEDDPSTAALVSKALQNGGYEVVHAPDGEAALITCVEERPDVILLDVNLPKLDGFSVAQRLKGVEELSKERHDNGHLVVASEAGESCRPQTIASGVAFALGSKLAAALFESREFRAQSSETGEIFMCSNLRNSPTNCPRLSSPEAIRPKGLPSYT